MLTDVVRIRDQELERIARLSRQAVVAGGSGAIFEVGRLNGSAVSDGDAIAQSIDCADAFVVAIFSERKAPALTPGAEVTIRSDGWEQPGRWYYSKACSSHHQHGRRWVRRAVSSDGTTRTLCHLLT